MRHAFFWGPNRNNKQLEKRLGGEETGQEQKPPPKDRRVKGEGKDPRGKKIWEKKRKCDASPARGKKNIDRGARGRRVKKNRVRQKAQVPPHKTHGQTASQLWGEESLPGPQGGERSPYITGNEQRIRERTRCSRGGKGKKGNSRIGGREGKTGKRRRDEGKNVWALKRDHPRKKCGQRIEVRVELVGGKKNFEKTKKQPKYPTIKRREKMVPHRKWTNIKEG